MAVNGGNMTAPLLYCLLESFLDDQNEGAVLQYVSNNAILLQRFYKRESLPRVAGFAERTVPEFLEEDFRIHFRITKHTYLTIVEALQDNLTRAYGGGVERISPHKQILVFLSYMANTESMRQLSLYFGIGKATVHGILRTVKQNFCAKYRNIIKWPGHDEQRNIAAEFHRERGLPDIIGALDGSHIRLSAAIGGDNDYYNRKQFPSVQLQLVCDHQMMIRHIYTGWPGCTHDARVLRNSSLQDILERDELYPGAYIIADSAYPLRHNLITPFKDNGRLNGLQRRFNRALSSARQIVERCIGHCKGRFRRLREITVHDIDDITLDIVSGCILSNICILEGEDIEQYIQDLPDNHPNMYPNVYNDRQDGVRRRQELMNALP